MTGSRRIDLVLFGPAVAWLVLAVVGLSTAATERPAVDRHAAHATGSDTCRRCHPEQHRTWFSSYHRTMTQRATSDAVLAPFSGETLTTLGFVATMTGRDEGRPHVRIVADDPQGDPGAEVLLDVDVELTVGSHHYQQYVARIDRGGGELERWRLPVAWHIGAQRWIHMGGAFLTPDGADGDPDDYLRHLSRWSDNCIFCHNTEPAPGLTEAGTWAPEIAELGIACEACHGRASEHVARHRNPMARLLTAIADRDPDDTLAQPDRLEPGLAADVCGRCHGQRIAKDIDAVMVHGDRYVPGEPLQTVSRPIVVDADVQGLPPKPFASRFWRDGTPRLSAYEYQGLLGSPCFDGGEGLSCGDCHTMHGEQPDGQLRADFSPTHTCGRCHEPDALSRPAAADAQHGGHEGLAVDCLDCHMPATTYGLLTGMLSHQIRSPDPGALVGRHDQPDACTQCHVDRSRSWAASAMTDVGLSGSEPGAPEASEAWGSRVLLDLLGGDPVQRALATHALRSNGATLPVLERARWLVAGLADEYPAVRFMAWRGLTAMLPDEPYASMLADYDFMGPLHERIAIEAKLRARLGEPPLSGDDRLEQLAAQRDTQAIWIGE